MEPTHAHAKVPVPAAADPWELLREMGRRAADPNAPFQVTITVQVPELPAEQRTPGAVRFGQASRQIAREFLRGGLRAMRVSDLSERLGAEVPEDVIRAVLTLHQDGFVPRDRGWYRPVPEVVEGLAT